MNKNKTIYLMIFLIVVLGFILVIKNKLSPQSTSTTSPENSDIVRYAPSQKPKIISTNITDKPVGVTEKIDIKFDIPIDKIKPSIQVTPSEEVDISENQDSTELSITPTSAWDYDTQYTILILGLDKDYKFIFQSEAYIGI